MNFEFPDTLTTDSESSWAGDFENNLGFAVTSCAIKIYTRVLYHEFFIIFIEGLCSLMGKALDFRAGGPRFKSHLSQYLPNFYWNFFKNGTTGQGQIMCFFEILRSRAFRICGQSVWESKIHKIRRQGTVPLYLS